MINEIMNAMIEYYQGDAKRIHHFIKVYLLAKHIGELQHLTSDQLYILEIAALVHDIGIKEAELQYGNSNGLLQQKIGPDVAIQLLQPFCLSDEVIDRVCYLIAHHHTYENIDDIDYQILVEADFLVNIFEDNMSDSQIASIEHIFKTATGIHLLSTMY